jgi:predicted ester cyclase
VRWQRRMLVGSTFSGTHQGTFSGIPATRRSVVMLGISIYRLVDHKIAEVWSNFDELGLLQQLGVIPAPGEQG